MTAPMEAASVFEPRGLEGLRREAASRSPEAVREAARQFESLFTRMLLKSMREASFGDSLFESEQQGFYRDLFDDQLAVELTRGRGLGLAEMMVEQLRRAGVFAESETGRAATRDAALQPSSASSASSGAPDVSSTGGSWKPASQAAFVRELWPHARAAGEALGVDPRAILAQAALETSWGRSMPCGPDGRCSFNLFGIKAGEGWRGDAVSARTLEFEQGMPRERRERFRAYDSPAQSFEDYVALLRGSSRYAEALGRGADVESFARGLARGGYATDPDYVGKLAGVAARIDALLPEALKLHHSAPMTGEDAA